MSNYPGHLTGRQIAAENRRRRDAAAAVDPVDAARLAAADHDDPDPGPFDAEARPVGDLEALTAADSPLWEIGGPTSFEESAVGRALAELAAADPHVDVERNRAAGYLPSDVQTELRARLDSASAPTPGPVPPPVRKFAPGDRPRIVDGIVIPAQSVADSTTATWVLLPVGEVATIGVTARAVGVTPKTGRWLAVWIGDDRNERDAVLDELAADYATARRSRRG